MAPQARQDTKGGRGHRPLRGCEIARARRWFRRRPLAWHFLRASQFLLDPCNEGEGTHGDELTLLPAQDRVIGNPAPITSRRGQYRHRARARLSKICGRSSLRHRPRQPEY